MNRRRQTKRVSDKQAALQKIAEKHKELHPYHVIHEMFWRGREPALREMRDVILRFDEALNKQRLINQEDGNAKHE